MGKDLLELLRSALPDLLAGLGVAAILGILGLLWRRRRRQPPPGEPARVEDSTRKESATASGEGAVAIRGDVSDASIYTGPVTIHEAAAAPSRLHELLPPPRDFTGRVAELAELLAALETGGAVISGLRGMGGVGKTALAFVLAEKLTPRYPDAQFYLDLRGSDPTPLPVAEALAHVIRAYYPPEAKLPQSEAELGGLYRSVLHGKKALLLLDNAADAAQVTPLLPPTGCCTLVTSRQHFALPGLYAMDLDTLPLDDARALLLKIAPRLDTPLPLGKGSGVRAADALARLCGCLPLALRVAASTLAERVDLDVADYMRRLADVRQRLTLTGVEATLRASYDLLREELQARWRTLAVFPGAFDAQAAASVWGLEFGETVETAEQAPDAAQEALSELVQYSLVEWIGGRYRLHDLARLFADAQLANAERATAWQRHAAHYEAVALAADDLYLQGGSGLLQGLGLFDLEWGNIQAGQAWAAAGAAEDEAAARLCSAYPDAGAHCLDLRQHPRERIRWREAALAAARRLGDRAAEGAHLGNLGNAYAALGEARRAIAYYEQQLVITREIGDRGGEGSALGNLGNAYADLGRRAAPSHTMSSSW